MKPAKVASVERASGAMGAERSELWTVNEVAAFARLSRSKVYRDAEAGLIPCRRWGRRGPGRKPVLRFYRDEIVRWLDAGCPVPSIG